MATATDNFYCDIFNYIIKKFSLYQPLTATMAEWPKPAFRLSEPQRAQEEEKKPRASGAASIIPSI